MDNRLEGECVIPGYEAKETYTHDELTHIIAREATKNRLEFLENVMKKQWDDTQELFKRLDDKLSKIELSIEKSAKNIESCREELRLEIERDFATKIELQELRGEIRLLSMKIVFGTGILVTLIQFISDKLL